MQLAKNDKTWNPYQVGDELVFLSNKGERNTFYISEIESVKVRNNPYAGNLSGTRENQFTYVDTSRTSHTPKDFVFLAIGKDSDNKTWINFVLHVPETIDANHNVSIDDVSRLPELQLTIGNKQYQDVIELNPRTQGGSLAFPEIEKIWWSKSKGYVRYALSDGTVWSLQ